MNIKGLSDDWPAIVTKYFIISLNNPDYDKCEQRIADFTKWAPFFSFDD